VIISPRADTLNKTVNSINEEIKKEFKDTPHTVTVNHTNITQHIEQLSRYIKQAR
jgi:hypothetical protein